LYNENLLDSYDEKVLSKYMRDGVHPGVAGHRILGEHIASELIRMKMEK
jgi:lysophospholipase L1-like esterase